MYTFISFWVMFHKIKASYLYKVLPWALSFVCLFGCDYNLIESDHSKGEHIKDSSIVKTGLPNVIINMPDTLGAINKESYLGNCSIIVTDSSGRILHKVGGQLKVGVTLLGKNQKNPTILSLMKKSVFWECLKERNGVYWQIGMIEHCYVML